jgi:polyisoprenoid-binding protein YceI
VLGTMPLESGIVRFDLDTGEASGEIVMDPLRAQTGIQRRDRTMREVVFEVVRFPRVVFRPESVAGSALGGGKSELQLHGTVAIHGTEHAITLPVAVESGPDGIRATTTFEVPYVAWGMRNPGNAVLNVDDTVEVKIETAGVLE